MNTTAKKNKMQGKKSSHRNAIIKSLLIELVRNEKLQTTPAKAKLLKAEFDKLVNEAKKATIASRRNVEAKLPSSQAVEKLYDKLVPRLAENTSGYVLSARTLPRKGDNAEQMILMVKGAEVKERKSRLGAALARRQKTETAEQGVTGRIRQAVRSTTGGKANKKVESQKDVRRVST